MGFGVDYSQASEGNDLLPEGEYEVIIKYASESNTRGGTTYLNIACVIRNDINQQYKNKNLWHSIFQKKEPSPADLACNGYSSKQIQSLSKASGLQNGKKYESLADWCDDLKDHVILVTVEHDTYQGKTQARVKWTNESKFPQCKHEWKKADPDIQAENVHDTPTSFSTASQQDFEEIVGDDDLPF